MTTLLVAHGTREPSGTQVIHTLAAAAAEALDEPVRVAFVDVHGPAPDEVLRGLRDEPVTLVPAFLASGKHVRRDIPRYVAASQHKMVTITRAVGPSAELTWALRDRLQQASWQEGDSVILAAAGSNEPHARCDVDMAARMLSVVIGEQVPVASCSPPRDGLGPLSVGDAVAAARDEGADRVAIASYLLADGLFQARLRRAGADSVAEPLGLHPAVLEVICRCRRSAAKRTAFASR